MKTRPHFLVPIALTLTTVFLTGGVSGLIAADKPDSAKIEAGLRAMAELVHQANQLPFDRRAAR